MFLSCPIRAEFITTVDDARSYYAHKMVGDRQITLGGRSVRVRFNPEEIHLFTESGTDCSAAERVQRHGPSGEVRCFSQQRARLLDDIVPALEHPTIAVRAKMWGGTLVIGPADGSGIRLGVVVGKASDPNVFFVRTAYLVTAKQFTEYRRTQAAPWPP